MRIKTELPEIFEEFDEARRQGFIQVKQLKEKGVPVIGVYCTFMPEELIIAANAVQISLCSTSDETIATAEEDLPRNLCPLIKSSYGFAKTDKCPFFYFSDLVVGETTCDGKKKMYEYMEEFKPLYLMQLPNMKNSKAAFDLWKDEIVRFKEKLEAFLDVTITEKQIREAIHIKNLEREARKNFYGLGKINPTIIKGSEIFKVMYGVNYTFEKDSLIKKLNDTTKLILEQDSESIKPQFEGTPRILITGSPMGGVTEKVIRAVEENGGTIVGFENCTVAKAVERLVDEEKEDVYEALAEKYIDIGCACMSNNVSRFALLEKMIEEYEVDGILDMVLQSCHPYSVESLKVKRFCQEEKKVAYLYLETDYSTTDIEQINTRVAAFIEMLEE